MGCLWPEEDCATVGANLYQAKIASLGYVARNPETLTFGLFFKEPKLDSFYETPFLIDMLC